MIRRTDRMRSTLAALRLAAQVVFAAPREISDFIKTKCE